MLVYWSAVFASMFGVFVAQWSGSGGLRCSVPHAVFGVYFYSPPHLSMICCVIFVFAGRELNFFHDGRNVIQLHWEGRSLLCSAGSSSLLSPLLLCCSVVGHRPPRAHVSGPASHAFHPALHTSLSINRHIFWHCPDVESSHFSMLPKLCFVQ